MKTWNVYVQMVLHKMHIECILVHLKNVKYCEKFIILFKKVNIHVNVSILLTMAYNSVIQFLKLLKYFIFSVSKLLFTLSLVTTVVGKNADSTAVQMIEFMPQQSCFEAC